MSGTMRKKMMMLCVAIAAMSMVMISCSDNKDNVPGVPETPENEYGIEVEAGMTIPENKFLKVPAVAGDQNVINALKAIDRVTDVKAFELSTAWDYYNDKYLYKTAYYFNYKQDIDHNNPSKGWFKQQCVLTVAGQDRPTVLHTEGYALGRKNNELHLLGEPMLVSVLNANCLQVEYRYHGWSLPEGYTNKFHYLTCKQQSDDLHAIVTAIKQSGIVGKDSKWLSTGVSKNGMTTAHYAYHYPNEMDAYVPFCAPFLVGLSNTGPYSYILQKEALGGDETKINAVREAFRNYISDKELQAECVKLYKQKKAKDYTGNDEYTRKLLLEAIFSFYFAKMSYVAYTGWEPMIPKKGDSAEKYYNFIMSDGDWEEYPGETETQYYRRKDYVDDFEPDTTLWSTPYALRRAQQIMRLDPYYTQTCIDLGNYVNIINWAEDLLTDEEKQFITEPFNPADFGVTYDNGKFINEFFEGMKNSDCNIMFVYSMQDPWTGGQIPDQYLGKNSSKLFISSMLDSPEAGYEAGLHNDAIDKWSPSDRNELFKWLNKVGFLPDE